MAFRPLKGVGMDSDDFSGTATSRRDFLRAAGLGAMAVGLGANVDASAAAPASARPTKAARDGTGIQERVRDREEDGADKQPK